MAAKSNRKKHQQQPAQEPMVMNAYWRVAAYSLASFAVVAVLFFAWTQITRDDVLPINELRVVGEFDKVAGEEIKDIVNANMGGNFFTLDVGKIHRAVVSQPWVHFAWVDRVWPNIVQVRVVEEKPVAYLQGVGLLNSEGEVFLSMDDAEDNTLPVVKGPVEERETLVSAFQKYNQQFLNYGTSLAQLEVDDRGSWKLRLSNNVEIMMGHEGVEDRLTRFLSIFGEKLSNANSGIKRIDLRYSNGFALSSVDQGAQLSHSLNVVS